MSEDAALWQWIAAFLYHEAEVLDERRFDEWLDLLDDEIVYRVPVRATRPEGQEPELSDRMFHFDETKETLVMRVDRLQSGDAWAEVPPSRTRHFVTNVRVTRGEDTDAAMARSNLLLMRNRGDEAVYQSLTGERHDLLRHTDGGWRLLRREVFLDVTTLPTYNLAFFL